MTHLTYINGHPEVRLFIRDVFMKNKSEAFTAQFKDADFKSSFTESQYATLFDSDDIALLNSIYNFTTVKTLFELGESIDAKPSETTIDVSSFSALKPYLFLTEKECYVFFKYLQNLSKNTYLQGDTEDLASFASITAPLFKKDLENFEVDFGTHMIGTALFKFLYNDTCAETIQRLFPSKNISRMCASPSISPNTKEGIFFWIRLYIGRRQSDVNLLQSLTSYNLTDFESEFDSNISNFNKYIESILDAIGMGKIRDRICDQDYNFLCSIHELALNQWLLSEFTHNVPALFKNDITPSYSWVESFKLDDSKYFKNELEYFVQIQPKFANHTINLTDCFNEFKPTRIFESLYLMSFLQNKNSSSSPFKEDVFVSYLGIIYRNQNFAPLIKNYFIQDLLLGKDSEYLTDLQRKSLQAGGNPMVKTTFRAIPYPELKNNMIKWQLLSGEKVEDFVRRIYSYNSKYTYATATKYYYHSDNIPRRSNLITEEYQPWSKPVYLSYGSDSIQYEPDIGQKSDIAYYTTMFKAYMDLDYDDVVSVYDTKTYEYLAKGNFYDLSKDNMNSYYNYVYEDSFNATEVFKSSTFITTPFYSMFSGSNRDNA